MNKEIIEFVKNNWFSLIAVLVLLPLIVGLGIKYIDYIPFLNEIPGDNGDWLGFWSGYLGSIVGIGGAYYVMRHQLEIENKKESKDKEPLLVPGTAEHTNLILIPGKDMSNDGQWFKDLKEFSEVSFPLINGGTTPIFDIKYSYTIDNFDEYKKIFTKEAMFSTMVPRMYIGSIIDSVDSLHYFHEYEKEDGIKGTCWVRKHILNYSNFLPVIMPGETKSVKLPITAIMLLSYTFSNYIMYLEDINKDFILPELTVALSYKDFQLKERETEFQLRISSYNTSSKNAHFRLIPINLKAENL